MSYTLRLTDGTTTVVLVGGPDAPGTASIVGLDYGLEEGALELQENAGLEDGARVVNVRRENVAEACKVSLGDALELAWSLVRQIVALFTQAELRQETGRGPRVYLEVDPNGTGNWYYRSEILAGHLAPEPQALQGYWRARGRLRVTLRWRRSPWWEGDERPVFLRTAGPYADGIPVYNHWDSGHRSGARLNPEHLDGDLPGPCRLSLRNDSAHTLRRVWLAHNVSNDPVYYVPTLEGEACLDGTLQEAQAYPSFGGGYYRWLTWTGATEQRIGRWDLNATWLGRCGGLFFKVLMRLVYTIPAAARVRLALNGGGVDLWRGPEVLVETGHEVQDLGVMQLPPGGVSGGAGLQLHLYARQSGGGEMKVDWLQVLPLDGWRRYEAPGGVAVGESLVDDGMAGLVYVQAGTNQRPGVSVRGAGIQPRPGVEQAVYVVAEDSTGQAYASDMFTLFCATRPRKALPVP